MFGVTAAHSDQEGVGAAERRHTIIADLDGQSVNVLRRPAETLPDHHHRRRVVCGTTDGKNLSAANKSRPVMTLSVDSISTQFLY